MVPHAATAGAILLCVAATFVVGVFAHAVLFRAFPFERALPFFLVAMLFYAAAGLQIALGRWARSRPRS